MVLLAPPAVKISEAVAGCAVIVIVPLISIVLEAGEDESGCAGSKSFAFRTTLFPTISASMPKEQLEVADGMSLQAETKVSAPPSIEKKTSYFAIPEGPLHPNEILSPTLFAVSLAGTGCALIVIAQLIFMELE